MELSPGTRLGRYELLGPLGKGGMGEVYRARDERLGREVAIKVLPPAFARDADRISRFEREARLLAALNHPGIAAIYEVGEQDGRHYLVLELVPGDTLAERLRAGPLALEEALGISRQIAEALEAAHGQGIVHRDLKPANVKLTPSGKVKLLDFGLAKDVAPPSPASDVSSSPTRSIGATEAGVVLGTVDYMSPEQARGKPIDKRTDVWAFGCVLYELLTRRPAFAGDTASDVIARVLTRDPDWQTLPPNTPPGVVSLLRRCLQRDLDRRLRDVGDARLEIEEALTTPAATLAAATPGRERRQRAVFAGLVLLAAVSMALALWGWTRRPRSSPQPVMRFAVGLPPGFRVNDVELSPDATRLVFDASPLDRVGSRGLLMRRLDQLEATAIPGADDSISPFFSPDGQWLGFKKGEALFKLPLAGGAPVKICDARSGGASWGNDGTIYFHPAPFTGISRVSASGGTPQQLTSPETQKEERGHSSPHALPDGRGVLFTIDYAHKPNSVGVHSPGAGKRVLIESASDARYVPTGHLLYRQAGKLMGVRFDLERLEVIPPAVPLMEGSQYFGVAASGALAYVPASRRETERVLLRVDRKGTARPLTQTRRAFERPRFSPDGDRVAVTIRGVDSPDVWIYQIKQDTLTRLTTAGRNRAPIWTPDGKRVTYVSVKGGRESIVSRPADGSGGEEELFESADLEDPTSWSPDGRTLAFEQYSGHPSYYDLWLLSLQNGRTAKPFLRTPFYEGGGAISPDGRWIAYASTESGRWQVYVQPLPGPGGKQLVSTQQGVAPVWSRNVRELFYLENDRLMVADVGLGPVFRVGRPRPLFNVAQGGDYDAAPDGQSFVMLKTERNFPPTEAIVVLNWLDELKRLVPTQH